ncbi:ABC transporter permease subunit [Desulfobulbus oligotrophicus]|jgi:branched-chain amino acid transport system permease protein|uniref:Branched-chain amino acid ABC transporter permease n=1 Tax=Desulfobulbus oligotrophicus TaxID=1909699 RepID=A0A7T6AR61_9BACT|nr:branched-chain amino acid ABC transporter permease [Desulfobulbus oligotrophicus]MDY0390611.1 branched-chain amino acid ABC transporter permease [Desulfobulbus oligotrophicus]QQG66456.1 branched-chain amino acid ABC transporter permease [Desulfobulbus oligotrophicus]
MITRHDLRHACLTGLWFMFLTFPLVVIKVNPIEHIVLWRWSNMLWIGVISFLASLIIRLVQARRLLTRREEKDPIRPQTPAQPFDVLRRPAFLTAALIASALLLTCFPLFFSSYQVNIMTTALMYVVLGLGLNIVVGMVGLLDLGYVAFYAVGAYTYALLHLHFNLGFWMALPIGGLLGALFGLLLGFPVLRLRGDYLAIVTLAFGQIVRLVLENWSEFSKGPSGIANIARPSLFGLSLSPEATINYLYYLMIGLVVLTVFVVYRLQNSRIGRAWQALREDEIACQAMGIDKTKIKLSAFALGATWAGMAGVFFAAKTTFVNPASFTFMESAIILCIVVLGGMGSIVGVIAGALILILLPEYLRIIADYRMLAFGAILVVMMIVRPQGLIAPKRRTYTLPSTHDQTNSPHAATPDR